MSKLIKEPINQLRNLITINRENVHYTKELQKRHYNEITKFISYVPDDKIWSNSKFIKTKNRNLKLEPKFFRLFRVLNLITKQAYKLELVKKCKVYNVFYVSLLKQKIIRKKRVNNTIAQLKLKDGDSKKYKVNAISDNFVNNNKLEHYLPNFNNLVLQKIYLKKNNI